MLQIIQIITNKHKNISSYQWTHSSPNTKKSNKKTPLFQHSQINLPPMKWIPRSLILNLSSQSSYKPHQPTLSIFIALASPFSLFIDSNKSSPKSLSPIKSTSKKSNQKVTNLCQRKCIFNTLDQLLNLHHAHQMFQMPITIKKENKKDNL